MKRITSLLAVAAVCCTTGLHATSRSFVAVGGEDGPEVRVADGRTSTTFFTDDLSDTGDVLAIEWSTCGNYLLTGGATDGINTIHVYDFDTQTLSDLGVAASTGGTVNDVTWRPDAQFFATVDETAFRIWDFDRVALTATVTESVIGGPERFGVDWHPGGGFIAEGLTSAPEEIRVSPINSAGMVKSSDCVLASISKEINSGVNKL